MKLVIFGSSGPVFEALTATCRERGYEFVIFGRGKVANHKFDIHNRDTWPSKVEGDVVVNLAWDMNERKISSPSGSVLFADYLLQLCSNENQRLIFISSVSAKSDSLSIYGKMKFHSESNYRSKGKQVMKLAFLDDKVHTRSINTTNQILRFLRKIPISVNITGMKPIPTISNFFLKQQFEAILIDPKIECAVGIERLVNSIDFFSNSHSLLTIDVPFALIEYIQKILLKLPYKPTAIIDRWLSLVDSTSC